MVKIFEKSVKEYLETNVKYLRKIFKNNCQKVFVEYILKFILKMS